MTIFSTWMQSKRLITRVLNYILLSYTQCQKFTPVANIKVY